MKDIDFLIERKILKIGNMLSNTRSEDLKKYGLTPVQSETLLFYTANPGASILDLKEHLDISHQAARNLVERLKSKQLLCVETSAEDGRFRRVRPTKQGEMICSELTSRGSSVGHDLLRGISEAEKEELFNLLVKISDGL